MLKHGERRANEPLSGSTEKQEREKENIFRIKMLNNQNYSNTVTQLLNEIQAEVLPLFEGKETEENWESRERGLNRLKVIFTAERLFARLLDSEKHVHDWQQNNYMKSIVDSALTQSVL